MRQNTWILHPLLKYDDKQGQEQALQIHLFIIKLEAGATDRVTCTEPCIPSPGSRPLPIFLLYVFENKV